MTNAAVYCRISKDDAGEHLGVERQERLCRDLARRDKLTIVDVFVDNDLSAYNGKIRPAFDRLVESVRAGEAGAIVTYHADRLYRRTTDLERLVDVVESTRAQVHTVAAGNVDLGTASGRMVARMLGAAAQHESERMGERLRAKHDELAARGRPPGGRPPFGYAWGYVPGPAPGTMTRGYVIAPAEATALRRMARRVLEGGSLLAISRELDAAGITTREGRPWHHSSVRVSLLNPAVVALRVHRREVAGPGDWEPVLDRQTWEQVRAVLADPARKRTRPARRYLLAGLVTNPNGDHMNGRPDRAPGGAKERRCYATHAPASPSLSTGADALEALIVETVLATLDGAALPVPDVDDLAGADVARIEQEIAELAALRGSGVVSLAEWMAARDPLLARLATAKKAAGTARRPPASVRLLSEPGAVRRAWPTLDFDARREIVLAVIERIVIGPAHRGRWTPIADRLLPEHGGRIEWRA